MKIAIDVSQIVYGTGVSMYTRSLVDELLLQNEGDEYILFGGSLRRRSEIRSFHNAKAFPISPSMADFIWNSLHVLPIERLTGKVDVFHSSDWSQPPSKAFKVTTVHDLTPIMYPEKSHPKIVSVHARRMKWVKAEVDRVIVPSKATGDDCLKLGIETSKIRVIPEAVDSKFLSLVNVERKFSKQLDFLTSKRFVFTIGTAPRKNIPRIYEAFTSVKDSLKLDCLVVVGEKKENQDRDDLVYVGNVDIKDLVCLFKNAQALVYASLYEGFGIPILEAFTAGCPVITSNISSMVEIAGDAAIIINPEASQSIANGLLILDKKGKENVKKGMVRSKLYSWKKTAQMTLDVYKESI